MKQYKLRKDIRIGNCEVVIENSLIADRYKHRAENKGKNLYFINGMTSFFIGDIIGIDINEVASDEQKYLDEIPIDKVAVDKVKPEDEVNPLMEEYLVLKNKSEDKLTRKEKTRFAELEAEINK